MPKPTAGSRKDEASEISVKARRLPVKLPRLSAAPSLRVLNRATGDQA